MEAELFASGVDQILAPERCGPCGSIGLRPGLKQWVRPGESALARWAMTCSDDGRFSGEPTGAGAGLSTS